MGLGVHNGRLIAKGEPDLAVMDTEMAGWRRTRQACTVSAPAASG